MIFQDGFWVRSVLFLIPLLDGCAVFTARPVQEMTITAAAIRAAREVQADVLSPEFYRYALEWFFKAKKEYNVKNFYWAKVYAEKAKLFAEKAEFRAIQKGVKRTVRASAVDPLSQDPLEVTGSGDGSALPPRIQDSVLDH